MRVKDGASVLAKVGDSATTFGEHQDAYTILHTRMAHLEGEGGILSQYRCTPAAWAHAASVT